MKSGSSTESSNAFHRDALELAQQKIAIFNTCNYFTREIQNDGTNLLVKRRHILVRAAHPINKRHQVTVHGKRYEYNYSILMWNLHSHGRRPNPAPSLWLLCAPIENLWLVIPGRVLKGRLAAIIRWPSGPRCKALLKWRDRWDLV